MSKVLIVSRTRMKGSRVCVGGIDLDANVSVRLLNANGYHETGNECPYQIGDLWECSYQKNNRRPAPHLEDSNVLTHCLIQKGKCVTADQFIEILKGHGVNICQGPLASCFDGCLVEGNSRLYVTKDKVPVFSTCFWICDKPLRRNDFPHEDHVKKQLAYMDGSSRWGKSIAFVGLGDTPQYVAEGNLIRLSLANWWSKDADTEQRCYLQISGVY